MNTRNHDTVVVRNRETREAVFQYGADVYELPVVEVMHLMAVIEAIVNGHGTGLIHAVIDGSEKVFLISAGTLITFHLPVGVVDDDSDEVGSLSLDAPFQ